MQTTDAIQAIWYPARRLLFAWPWRQDAIFRRLAAILKRAGLPNGPRDLFHKFRRTTASHIAAAAGIDAATRQLGQSGSAVTKRYIDPTIARAHVDGAAYLPRPSMPRALPAAGETAKSPRAYYASPVPRNSRLGLGVKYEDRGSHKTAHSQFRPHVGQRHEAPRSGRRDGLFY